jgi:hypothetical protein
MSGIYVN